MRPMIWTEDFDETIEFYTKLLGFKCEERNDGWGWASLSNDWVDLMISTPNEESNYERIFFSGSFYFNTDDVEGLWNRLKDQTEICYPIETFEWGMREFGIYDNNGYILQFGQELTKKNSTVVRRLELCTVLLKKL